MSAEIHVLKFLTGKYKGEEFPLGPDRENYVVGRSSDSDLVLADDAVSRKHARFFAERQRMWVRDLGSRNGVVVNGTPVRRHCLRAGDRIAIGGSLMSVVVAKPSQVSAAPRAGEKKRRTPVTVDFSNRSMTGSIEEIPLVDVLQWLSASRKTGTLNVRNLDTIQTGRVYLRDGYAFSATIDKSAATLLPEKALMRMLAWKRGTFALENSTPESAPTLEIRSAIEHILMESARQQDEIQHLAEKTPVPHYGADVTLVQPCPVRWHSLSGDQLDMVQDLAEGKTWSFILDAYPQDDLALTKMIVELKKKRVVEYS
jgi:pSer/pThr/pTyr-binding forkhead associated (FHA) protein